MSDKDREKYLRSMKGDLTSYASLIGDGFAAKIDLLAQIIKDKHHPSLGRYKERLLMKVISDFVPSRFGVGTGFVLFPKRRKVPSKDEDEFDMLELRGHDVSRQLDIIVYESSEIPAVFSDGDFVVLRPESVRAVVEVKGTLDPSQVKRSMDILLDFSDKWSKCKDFYGSYLEKQTNMIQPNLYIMGFQVGVDKNGKKRTDGGRVRRQIAKIISSRVSADKFKSSPMLSSLFIYDDCEIVRLVDCDQDGMPEGYATMRGKFVKYSEEGELHKIGDKTIASLIAGIHHSLNLSFNPFFSYQDQCNRVDTFPHEHQGFTELRFLI